MRRHCSYGLLLLLLVPSLAGAGALQGKVQTVTLYRGQALVTRLVSVDAKQGATEIVVSGLPENIVHDSLFAEAGDGVEIRAVRFRTRAVGEEPREEVRKIEEELQTAVDKKIRAQALLDLVQKRLQYLQKLEGFSAPTAKVEMSKGVLDFKTLREITLFTFEERQKAADESLKLQGELRTLARQEALLQRQRSKLTAGSSRTEREALLFLEKPAGGRTDVRLSYLVRQAGWSPVYTFRAGADRTKVDVEYNALIQQMSGEDWTGVKLTLSTASPALSAQGPGLAPWRVDLTRGQAKGKPSQQESAQRYQKSQQQLQQAEQGQRGAQAFSSNLDFNWKMNTAAFETQNLELLLEKDALQSIVAEPAQGDGTSVTYELATPVSLASRSDQQMLRIADMKLPSAFAHVATPILTSYVYREAELTNDAIDALLAGPVSVYLDGRFVGRGEIPTVARGETFAMGFGADAQVRTRRELIERDDSVQGGNREIRMHVRLVLENFKDKPVAVRLLDRYPVSERDADIRVTFEPKKSPELAKDPLYLRLERPKGILRWDVDVPAQAAGEKVFALEYGYSMEFQRELAVSTPAPAASEDLRQEFERMQSKRLKR